MTTGPQHYRAAEKLADQANHFTHADPVMGAALAAEAQVHATLAVAAATALAAIGTVQRTSQEWLDLIIPPRGDR